MRQFVLPDEWSDGERCEISGGRARYLVRVLRLQVGDRFIGLHRSGERRLCTILERESERVVLGVTELPTEIIAERIPTPIKIILVQALPKGAKMDLIVRQAAEAGVSHLI